MKKLSFIALACVLAATACAASLKDNIKAEALIVTKTELRRHLSAPEDDLWRPATYANLEASRGPGQPDYLIVRFQQRKPGHYYGEAEARIDGHKRGTRLNVVLHFNQGWVEYFIPLDGRGWPVRREGGPTVTVDWNSLDSK
jgi:hypothetical protein